MSEGITYNDLGTVDVTFDDRTYHLGRPKLRQWRYFTRRITDMTQHAQDTLTTLSREAEAALAVLEGDPDNEHAQALANEKQAALQEFAQTPFYETSSELMREMFAQLSDHPLPDDVDDWPVWLAADVSLPGQILAHWRKAPKVSGSNGATP
jgi:hypothetical protein